MSEASMVSIDMPPNNAVSPLGRLEGRGVVRDKDGNIKGEITFSAEATPEQVKAVLGVDVSKLQSA